MAVDTREILRTYTAEIKTSFNTDICENLVHTVSNLQGDIDTKKVWLDQAFREYLTNEILLPQHGHENISLEKCDKYVELTIKAAQEDICSKTLPIQILSDMFDIITLEQCESLFSTIERNISLWKNEEFFTPVRNNLLRICNDLLRRLSRSQNTVFCGRILLFLAKFFPFSERSGLNVVSEFNLENTTVFSTAGEAGADENGQIENMETDENNTSGNGNDLKIEADQRSLKVDYALYSKFWQLQDYFRNPSQCYTNVKWRTFSSHATDVLNTFKSYKVDVISGKKKRRQNEVDTSAEKFFAKYLTNQNLLQLQLSDSNFRRYLLIQFLILFQYLKSTVKFKSESNVLTDEQSKWIDKTQNKVYELLEETPPQGKKFCQSVKHILGRETQWNSWKNQGCLPLAKKVEAKNDTSISEEKSESNGDKKDGLPRKRKARLGDITRSAAKNGRFVMGNPLLSKLWNQWPDNLEACSAPERDFLPSMEEYFGEAIEELDPANQIEDSYLKVNNGPWGWRALRLLAKKSPHFFTYGNNPIGKLPDYLEQMIKKMIKDNPELLKTLNGSSNGSSIDSKNTTTEPPVQETCTPEQLSIMASNLAKMGDTWTKIIPKLGLTSEDVDKINKEKDDQGKPLDEAGKALAVLNRWAELEGEASKDELIYILESLKLFEVMKGVLTSP